MMAISAALAGLALAGIAGVWDVTMDTLVSWQRRDKVSKRREISRAGVDRLRPW